MAKLKVYHDAAGGTLTVWFGSPEAEHVCEETGDEVILIKDRSNRVIGFEKLNYPRRRSETVEVAFATVGQ
jgi:hypothetical protein